MKMKENKKKKREGRVSKGGCCVLSTSTCVWNYLLPLSVQTCYLVPFDIIFGLFVHITCREMKSPKVVIFFVQSH
jgi:hypothetical protein